MQYEVAIIGCGPAALACVQSLPTDLPVLILEQHPPDYQKLCGGLLTKLAKTETLRQFGEIPAEIMQYPVVAENHYVDFTTGMRGIWPNEYRNIDRAAYDKWLLSKVIERYRAGKNAEKIIENQEANTPEADCESNVIQAGRLRVLFGHMMTGFEGNETGLLRIETIAAGQKYEFFAHVLVDATGNRMLTHPRKVHKLYSLQTIASVNPIPRKYTTIFDNSITPFFAWIIPKDDKCLIGVALELDGLKEHPRLLFYKLLDKLSNKLGVKIEKGDLRGSKLVQIRQLSDIDGGQSPIFRIGEAGGMISPSSGEGLSYALTSGRLLGQALGVSIQQGRLYKRKPLVFPYHEFQLQVNELQFNIRKSKVIANPTQRRFAEWVMALQNKFRSKR